jgi:ribosomal protein S12 methylthiotransferase accessory factor
LAAISALGEFIERNASSAYWWENSRLYKSKFNNNSVQVNPDLFNVFTDASIPTHKKIEKYQSTHSLYWMPAVNFTHNKKIHIPASLAYMYFRREHPNEPFLQEVSSNGAATYSNYTEACTRAILELIERHVFISLWYQKKPCSKLNLNSLRTEFIEFDELLKSLSVSQEINIYEITDFLEVPTFMALLTNKDTSKTALHVTAASDLDANNALQKIIKEIIRFAEEQYPIDKVDKIPVDVNSFSNVKGYPDSLPARRLLWSYQDMLQHLAWLEESQEIEYSDIRCIAADLATAPARYCWLQEQSVNNDVTFYIANMTNSVARYAGLQVVRAISPDTIPMFFNEEFLPLGHPAFTQDADGNKIELNPVPHPFI